MYRSLNPLYIVGFLQRGRTCTRQPWSWRKVSIHSTSWGFFKAGKTPEEAAGFAAKSQSTLHRGVSSKEIVRRLFLASPCRSQSTLHRGVSSKQKFDELKFVALGVSIHSTSVGFLQRVCGFESRRAHIFSLNPLYIVGFLQSRRRHPAARAGRPRVSIHSTSWGFFKVSGTPLALITNKAGLNPLYIVGFLQS